MATIVTRAGKGSPLTITEVDSNFTGLNTDKAELSGAAFTGAITTNSTVDGRDVATDGTKLDGIEASATADQTGAQIKTAYEAETNAFTDAQFTKLGGIEALATVTNTASVTAAGALMDSELTSIASVKALNQGVATTDSPTFVNVTATSLDISGNIDVDGTTNLDVVDIDGAVDMASTLTVAGALVVNNTSSVMALSDNAVFNVNVSGGSSKTSTINQRAKSSNGSNADTSIIVTGSSGEAVSSWDFKLDTTNGALTKAMAIDGQGDISFYEDTGTTPKLFWDASAESLGIGTTSPSSALDVVGTASATSVTSAQHLTAGSAYSVLFGDGGERISGNNSSSLLNFFTGATERMRIDSSGNVGIGTSSPDKLVHMAGANAALLIEDTNGGTNDKSAQLFVSGGSFEINSRNDDASTRVDNILKLDLGTGAASFGYGLDVTGTATMDGLTVNSGTANVVATFTSTDAYSLIKFEDNDTTTETTLGALDNDMVFRVGATERLRIASSGVISVKGGGGAESEIDSNIVSNVVYQDLGGYTGIPSFARGLRFFGNNASGAKRERARIDASGNLLLGKISAGDYVTGIEMQPAGAILSYRTSGVASIFGRTDDGEITRYTRGGAIVGRIGSYNDGASALYFADAGNVGIRLSQASTDDIRPCSSTGADRDAAINLGGSSARFKDAYLSGGVVFGTTGGSVSSKTLDDYEEGTWTPTLPSGGSLTVNRALYTKIGRQVSVQFYISAINATNDGAQFKIGNLPFTTSGISNSYSAGSISYSGQSDLGGLGLLNIVNSTSLYFHFIDGTGGGSVANNTFRGLLASASAGVFIAEISYFTDQ